MREILFRGKFGNEWKYGYLSVEPQGLVIKEPYIGNKSEIWHIDPETVGQYTGLTDKNGVRIFEGDIVSLVKHDGLIYKVVYVPCRYELVNSKGVNCFVLDIYKSENIEVIGNIHDNPELLGGENNGINR